PRPERDPPRVVRTIVRNVKMHIRAVECRGQSREPLDGNAAVSDPAIETRGSSIPAELKRENGGCRPEAGHEDCGDDRKPEQETSHQFTAPSPTIYSLFSILSSLFSIHYSLSTSPRP